MTAAMQRTSPASSHIRKRFWMAGMTVPPRAASGSSPTHWPPLVTAGKTTAAAGPFHSSG